MKSKFVKLVQCRRYSSFASVALNYTLRVAAGGGNISLAPIFMLHGLMGNQDNFRTTAQNLANKGSRNVYTLDMRNHGASPHSSEHSCRHVAADISTLMQAQGLQQIIALGHSSGGRGMMTLALTQPQLVERLIVVDVSPLTLPDNMMHMPNIFNMMIKKSIPSDMSLGDGRELFKIELNKLIGDEQASQLILRSLVKLPSGEFHWLINARAILNNWLDFTHYYDTITGLAPYMGPTLFIAGQRSSFVQASDVPGITEYFPNMRLEWLNAGHLVHIDQPQKFLELVFQFCK